MFFFFFFKNWEPLPVVIVFVILHTELSKRWEIIVTETMHSFLENCFFQGQDLKPQCAKHTAKAYD